MSYMRAYLLNMTYRQAKAHWKLMEYLTVNSSFLNTYRYKGLNLQRPLEGNRWK